jgi:hypothetical protein
MNNIDKILEYGKSKNKKSKLLNFENADELINFYFNPEDNGFKLVNYTELIENIKPPDWEWSSNANIDLTDVIPREIWTDSPCMLARFNTIKKK